MSINTKNNNSIDSNAVLDKAINQILGGHQPDALARLKKCGLFTDEQIAKIQDTLQEMAPTHLTTTPRALKERILVALNPDIKIAQTLSQGKIEPRCFKDRCHLIMPELNDDMTFEILKQCVSGNDATGIYALACTNKYFYQQITKLVGQLDLNELCPGLRILDAKTLQIEVDDEPLIKKLATIQCLQDMSPHVENNAGLTLLTIPKGLTLNQLVAIAASPEIGLTVDIIVELGDVPVAHTYRVVITNNVFIKSRNKSYKAQGKLALNIGCELPTVLEYLALCIFTKKIFNISLYHGKAPSTYARSSTPFRDQCHLVVGHGNPALLEVVNDNIFLSSASDDFGAGGLRK